MKHILTILVIAFLSVIISCANGNKKKDQLAHLASDGWEVDFSG